MAKRRVVDPDYPIPYGEDLSRIRPEWGRHVKKWEEPNDGLKPHEAVEEMKGKDEVMLSYCHLGDEGVTAVAEELKSSPTIKNLMLSYNKIGDEGARALAHAVRDASPAFTHLYLYNNNITDEGGKALLEAIKANRRVTVLGVTHNPIGREIQEEIVKQCELNAKQQKR